MEKQHSEWLVASIHYFRQIGFLSHLSGLSDEEAAKVIAAQEIEDCQRFQSTPFWVLPDVDPVPEQELNEDDEYLAWFLRPRPDRRDLCLLRADTGRLWWEDGEGDITPRDGTYARIIQEWSQISRGAFVPTDIHEAWEEPEQWPDCRVTVSLKVAHHCHTLRPWDAFGWIDFGILNGINELIRKSDLAFEMWDTGDQTTCLIVLSQPEKQHLVTERGWQFIAVSGWGDEIR